MRISAGKALAALALALTSGLAAAGSAHASTENWSQDDKKYLNNFQWYEAGFTSTMSYDDFWGNSLNFTDFHSWARSEGLAWKSVTLTDTWQADGIGLSSCSVSQKEGASCSGGGTQITATRESSAPGATDIDHRISSIGLGGALITWGGEWSTAKFVIGANLYEANASASDGWTS
ncbi:hypothetical protein [Streptomyces sp. NBC_00079]|uniref:hypothetical protein n=1 Tax=Streptomyces sp. NBC_00079 TaxID=2975644 RepID=UPI003250FA86